MLDHPTGEVPCNRLGSTDPCRMEVPACRPRCRVSTLTAQRYESPGRSMPSDPNHRLAGVTTLATDEIARPAAGVCDDLNALYATAFPATRNGPLYNAF